MPPLPKLWQAIEAVPGAAAAWAEWRERMGADFPFLERLLLPTDKFATSLPVADDPYASYRVVTHAPDDIVGVHDMGGPAISLSKRDVLIYRIDRRRIFQDVCAALGFEVTEASVDGQHDTYRIGTFRPFAGFAFPAFLAIPLEPADLHRGVTWIASEVDRPFIVLAPTANRLRPACESLLTRRKACFLALSEAIEMDGRGNWKAAPAAERLLSEFQQTAIPQAADTGILAFFPTPPNATWSGLRIKFIDGEAVSVKVGTASGTFVYSQMGMADGRNGKPNTRWRLLQSFAKGYGNLNWDSPDASPKNQKRRESLSRDLQAFFRIDGDPIQYLPETKGWRTLFAVEPDA